MEDATKSLLEYGSPHDCPVSHIDSFLEKCDTMKMNGVIDDVIRLRLFPFSLRDRNPTDAKELVEKMAANDNYHPGGRNSVKKGGKLDVDALTLLTSSVQALTSKFDRFQARTSTSSLEICQLCNVEGHIAPNYP
ncbi:uncharacterized protein LOC110699799 [Chenopodium quinoa]|uniref:uncharacterized protein LOC110699799 n=1 Tax=Chenopodium quinoa TaxID=63459 RepID=UPI000B799F6D|nr:uncharacterized protein LOC110699799 [Chenopodium quinoa]